MRPSSEVRAHPLLSTIIFEFKTACLPAFTLVSILDSLGSLSPWIDRRTPQFIPLKTSLLAAQGYRGFTVHQAVENLGSGELQASR